MLETSDRAHLHDNELATLDELLFDLGQRVQNGESVDLAPFKERFPEVTDNLDEAFEALSFLAKWTGDKLQPPTSFDPQDLPRETGVLGDYRLIREIGRGGMGVVYEAEQISLGRAVALKILPFAGMLDERQLTRFKNEARAAATLDHPHVVSVYAIGHESSVHFYAMQYVEGQSMAELIEALRQAAHVDAPADRAEGQPLEDARGAGTAPAASANSPGNASGAVDTQTDNVQAELSTERSSREPAFFRNVARLGLAAAEALDHAHAHGVLHRDVKPGNLMIDKDGNLLVTDFGLARLETDAGMTMSGDLMGTLRYMAPEQALAKRGVVDHRADIYSLGATLYELATLRPVFIGTDREELLNQIAIEEPPNPQSINPSIPKDLATIILKAIRKIPEDRYVTAQELADDLRRFLELKPIQAKPATPAERLLKWSLRHRALVLSSLAAIVLVSIVSVISTVLLSRAYLRETAALQDAEANYLAGRDVIDNLVSRMVNELAVDPALHEAGRRVISNEPLEYYKSILARAEKSPQIRSDAAWAALSLGDLQQLLGNPSESYHALEYAERLFAQLLREYSENPDYLKGQFDANRKLAQLASSTQYWEVAVAASQRALALSQPWLDAPPGNLEFQLDAIAARVDFVPLLNRTNNAGLAEKFRQAARKKLAALDSIVQQQRSDVIKARYYALRAAVGSEPEVARADLQLAIELEPDNLRYRKMLSDALKRHFRRANGAFDEMQELSRERLELIRGVMKEFPWVSQWQAEYVDALTLHAAVQIEIGAREEGLKSLREALTNAEDLLRKEPVYLEHHRLVARAAGELGTALANKNASLEAVENLQRSRQKWSDCVQQCPLSCPAINNRMLMDILLAKVYAKRGNGEKAKDSWTSAEAAIDDFVQVGVEAGDASESIRKVAKGYWLLENYDKASAAYEKAYALFPSDDGICNFYASSLIFGKLGDRSAAQRAKELASEAVRMKPGAWLFRTTLAAALYRNGEWQNAIGTLKSELSLPKDDFILAMSHWQLGHEELSRQHYARATDWIQRHDSSNDLGGELGQLRSEAEELLGVTSRSAAVN